MLCIQQLGEFFVCTNRERRELTGDSEQTEDKTQDQNTGQIHKIVDTCMLRPGSWMMVVKWVWLGKMESLPDLLELDYCRGQLRVLQKEV